MEAAAPQGGLPRIIDFAAIATVAAALVFTAGWSFIYHWYGQFSVGVIGLGIPIEYHFQYGFLTLWEHWYLALAALIVIGTWPYWNQFVGQWVWLTSPAWLLAAFVGMYWLGELTALAEYQRHRNDTFRGLPLVRVWMRPDTAADVASPGLPSDLADAKYRLLLQSEDELYLIVPIESAEVPVTILPISSVQALRIIPRNPGYK